MPSLNLKTKQLRYTKPDENALSAAATLLQQMREYDDPVFQDADKALELIERLHAHVKKLRMK